MPKTKVQKQDIVTKISEKLAKSKSVVFTNYQGLTMTQLSVMRAELRQQNSEYSITKNNLLKIALKNANLSVADDVLQGPIATLFTYEDEISPIKTVTKQFKEFAVGEVKGGLLNGETLSAANVNKLAALPTKDQLRGQVVGALGGPLYGIVGVLQANLRNLAYVIKAIQEQKGG